MTNSSKELLKVSRNTTADIFNKTLKIRDFAEDNLKFWLKSRGVIAKCSLILGSKAAPIDEEWFVIKETLMKSFKDFSPEDIIDAFDKLVAGKLNVEADKYGKITPAYLGQVLVAHREYRNKEVAKELKDRPKEEIIATNEDKAKIRAEFLENCLFKPYKAISEKGYFDADKSTLSILYRLFRRAKIFTVKPDEEDKYIDLAEKDLFNDARNNKKDNKPLSNFMTEIKQMNKGENKLMYNRITERACCLYFYEYIMNLNKANRDIKLIAEKL